MKNLVIHPTMYTTGDYATSPFTARTRRHLATSDAMAVNSNKKMLRVVAWARCRICTAA